MSKKVPNEKDDIISDEYYMKYNGLWGETLSQLKNRLVYSRRRKDMICIYCGDNAQTREHCPPRSFFPEHDFPDNLRVLPACENCNRGFSHDEEIVRNYLNCIYDCFCRRISEVDYSAEIKEYVEFTEKNKCPVKEAERIFSKVAQGLAIYEMSDCFGDCGWIPKVSNFLCKHWVSQKEWGYNFLNLYDEIGTVFLIFSCENKKIQLYTIVMKGALWRPLAKEHSEAEHRNHFWFLCFFFSMLIYYLCEQP